MTNSKYMCYNESKVIKSNFMTILIRGNKFSTAASGNVKKFNPLYSSIQLKAEESLIK